MNSPTPSLKLSYRLDAQTESENRRAVATVIGRLNTVRRRLGHVCFDTNDHKIQRSVEELAELSLNLAKLMRRL